MKEKMITGKLYIASDKELREALLRSKDLCLKYNVTNSETLAERDNILKQLLGTIGNNCLIEPPFYCDYGFNTKIGDNFYANHNCTILDGCEVNIGNNVLLGPNVGIYTATHPISGKVRRLGYEYAKPISIGNDVWIGGNSVILPGIKIGNNVVIGAGSVVTKDIPDNVVAAGNPCRVIREITEEDDKYFENLI